MLYKHPWLTIGMLHITLALLCYLFIFSSQQEKYQTGLLHKKQLTTKLVQLRASHPKKLIFPEKKNAKAQNDIDQFLAESHTTMKFILALAQQYALQLNTISYLTPPILTTAQSYEIRMLGEFKQLISFLYQLRKENLPLILNELHIQLDEQAKLSITLIISFATTAYIDLEAQPLPLLSSIIDDPFCGKSSLFTAAARQTALKATSLNLIRMVGYMGNTEKNQAIVVLPNSKIYNISIGDELGEQRAIVKAISAEKMVVELQDHRLVEILTEMELTHAKNNILPH